ncbi:MAG: ATP-dependent helicase, partial [Bacteroidota bacterium]
MSSAKHHYEASFAEAFARLNPSQRLAVNKIEGPVLVVAGPGTGKTQMLAARIGRILQTTDTRAANILCLTFTEAAVHAMRSRLLQWIGPEAHHVHIFTYHAFANKVIQENLHYFGFSDLRPLTELEQLSILRSLIEEKPMDHPLRKGKHDLYFFVPYLRHLFALMQRENWSVERCLAGIDKFLDSLPERPEYVYQRRHGQHQKGELKPGEVAKAEEQMERLRAGVNLFEAYQTKKQQLRVYDFADMLQWVLEAFAKHPNLLRRYQEQYLYLLVDEYQDTNGAQNALLQQLIDYWEAPNIFVVGDDDQSVFEFQGARLKNLLDLSQQYADQLQTILLSTNYRSGQALLDAASHLIGHNELRLTQHLQLNKKLVAAKDIQGPVPQLWEIPTVDEEVFHVADALMAWHEKGRPWEEMAVLYAKHRQVEPLLRILDQRGIPYQTRRRINLLDEDFIIQIRQLLEFVASRATQQAVEDRHLFQILHLPFWGITPRDLARLAVHQRQQRGMPEAVSWEALLWDLPIGLTLENPEALERAVQYLDVLTQLAATHSPLAVLEQLINRSGLLVWLSDHPDRL